MRIFIFLFSLCFFPMAVTANSGGESKEEETGIGYMEIKPKFTVNLAEPRKYLLVNLQLLVEGAEIREKITKNMPAIKHELIMLYSGRASDSLQTVEQREALRKETLESIQKLLEKSGKVEGLNDVFFTEFLIN
ncbi:MAG: flagellar basal body-associated FliL family protein [Methylococcaceae bacterium]